MTGQRGRSIVYTMNTPYMTSNYLEPWDYCEHCGQPLGHHVADQPCYTLPHRDATGSWQWIHMCYETCEMCYEEAE